MGAGGQPAIAVVAFMLGLGLASSVNAQTWAGLLPAPHFAMKEVGGSDAGGTAARQVATLRILRDHVATEAGIRTVFYFRPGTPAHAERDLKRSPLCQQALQLAERNARRQDAGERFPGLGGASLSTRTK